MNTYTPVHADLMDNTVYVDARIYAYIHTYIYICTCICKYIYTYTCKHIHTCLRISGTIPFSSKRAYMHIYIHTHTCICICIHIYIYIHICINTYILARRYQGPYPFRRCAYICMYTWIHICIHIYIYTCIYTYIYKYTYTQCINTYAPARGSRARYRFRWCAADCCQPPSGTSSFDFSPQKSAPSSNYMVK